MLLGPLTLLALVGDLIFNIPNVHFSRLLPVYAGTGPQGILAGSLPSLGFVGQTVLVSMFAPFMQTPKLMTACDSTFCDSGARDRDSPFALDHGRHSRPIKTAASLRFSLLCSEARSVSTVTAIRITTPMTSGCQ